MKHLDNLATGLMSSSATSRIIGAMLLAGLLWLAIAWAVTLP